MNKTINFKENRGVMSLVVVLVIGLFALAAALTVTGQIVVEIKKGTNTISGDRSFYTAEAAVREAVYQYIESGVDLSDNFPVSINDVPEAEILFEVGPSTQGWAYKDARGNARNINYREIKNTLLLFPSALAFEYAVYSEGDLALSGNVNVIGNAFSNGTISCNGNVQGEFFSSGSIEPSCGADPENSGINVIDAPTIDPYYYGGIADCTSTAANVETDCLTGPTTSGVIFVDDPGNTVILNGANLTGNLTVIGDLRLGGNSRITASSDHAAVVVDGDLDVAGTVIIEGLVYVTGSTTFSSGTPRIYGSLISLGGTTTLVGTVRIEHRSLSGPPTGYTDPEDPQIVGWQEE